MSGGIERAARGEDAEACLRVFDPDILTLKRCGWVLVERRKDEENDFGVFGDLWKVSEIRRPIIPGRPGPSFPSCSRYIPDKRFIFARVVPSVVQSSIVRFESLGLDILEPLQAPVIVTNSIF